MHTVQADTDTEVTELTEEEMLESLDVEARKLLGMSGEEFARKWRAGELRDHADPQVIQVAMLLPDAW